MHSPVARYRAICRKLHDRAATLPLAHAALPYKEIKLRKSTKQGCLRSFRRLFQRRAKCGKCGGKRVDVRLNSKEVRLPKRVKGWSRSLK